MCSFWQILWVVNGCGLHEMEFCSERRFKLPHYVLERFPPRLLKEAVVWQTVGAGFLMKDANRFKSAPHAQLAYSTSIHTYPLGP